MSGETTLRAFLAVEPPAAVRGEIAAIQERLKKTVRGVIRWVRPAEIHLTLKFFGNIPPPAVDRISEAVAARTVGVAPFDLTVRTVGVFPDLNRPRVVWLGMAGEVERLLVLQTSLERAFGVLGFPREERPFRAHLTLGRIKTPKGLVGLARAVEIGERATAGLFRADHLVLFRSELTPQGAVYARLAAFPLRG
ncbi:MAG: RNA 2',3'-cyclic phosphodiesterase [Syntrophales bacterium]|nr:RNA 2',3'-cyclic phosphodiesterase [Syntrophales bacterium]